MLGETDQETPPFEIFRATAAVDYAESGPMHAQPFSDIELEGSQRLADAGFLGGSKVKLLYSRPGMSLTYLWFKSGFPLPRHSHDADCLYFIVAGSIRLGNQELSPGDGFFLGSNVPYSYVPGAEGVELLEFRTSDTFDFKMQANNKSYWDKALASLLVARERWADETAPPSGMTIGAG